MALALTVVAGTANAAVVRLTVTGTANSNLQGYVAGQPYSFHWDLNSAFANAEAQTYFTTTQNSWDDDFVSESPIFVNAGGDLLTGAWQRPTLNNGDPYSYVDVSGGAAHNLDLYAADESFSYSLGLQLNGTGIVVMEAQDLNVGNIFSFSGSPSDPAAYFSALAGSYPVSSGTLTIYQQGDSTGVGFTPTALTIGVVPEPSTALLAGLGLMMPLFRRRSRGR